VLSTVHRRFPIVPFEAKLFHARTSVPTSWLHARRANIPIASRQSGHSTLGIEDQLHSLATTPSCLLDRCPLGVRARQLLDIGCIAFRSLVEYRSEPDTRVPIAGHGSAECDPGNPLGRAWSIKIHRSRSPFLARRFEASLLKLPPRITRLEASRAPPSGPYGRRTGGIYLEAPDRIQPPSIRPTSSLSRTKCRCWASDRQSKTRARRDRIRARTRPREAAARTACLSRR